MSATRKQTLVASVEDLTAAGYLVLGPENAEEAASLLGTLAFDQDVLAPVKFRNRAAELLSVFRIPRAANNQASPE